METYQSNSKRVPEVTLHRDNRRGLSTTETRKGIGFETGLRPLLGHRAQLIHIGPGAGSGTAWIAATPARPHRGR